MKRPKIDPGSYYTLTECARATGIPRGVLDHGCRSGRLPFRQTESGTRLLAGTVVAQLARDRDLRSFPKAYEAPPGPAPNLGYEQEAPSAPAAQGARAPSAADKLGLLGEPSDELRRKKELAETAKLEAEQEEARLRQERIKLERERLRREQQDELEERRRARAEELRVQQEEQAQRRRLEEESRQRAESERARRQERERWADGQFDTALREERKDFDVLGRIPYSERKQVKDRIRRQLMQALESLNPSSPLSACAAARRSALIQILGPRKCCELADRMFLLVNPIERYLDQLYDKGWTDKPQPQRRFLAERWKPEFEETLKLLFERCGGLTEAEAQRALEPFVEEKLGLNRRRSRSA